MNSLAAYVLGVSIIFSGMGAMACWYQIIRLRQDMYRMFNELQKEKKGE